MATRLEQATIIDPPIHTNPKQQRKVQPGRIAWQINGVKYLPFGFDRNLGTHFIRYAKVFVEFSHALIQNRPHGCKVSLCYFDITGLVGPEPHMISRLKDSMLVKIKHKFADAKLLGVEYVVVDIAWNTISIDHNHGFAAGTPSGLAADANPQPRGLR